MCQLTEEQLNSIVALLIDDYGTQMATQEVSEIIGFVLEDISGFETLDSQPLTQVIDAIRKKYYVTISKSSDITKP